MLRHACGFALADQGADTPTWRTVSAWPNAAWRPRRSGRGLPATGSVSSSFSLFSLRLSAKRFRSCEAGRLSEGRSPLAHKGSREAAGLHFSHDYSLDFNFDSFSRMNASISAIIVQPPRKEND